MRYILIVFALLFAACAPYQPYQQPRPAPGYSPLPPGFPVGAPIDPNARYCGGMVAGPQQSCYAGEYCHRNIADMCGAADAPGICRPVPQMCTRDYRPVCGCDGRTYSNECVANSQGVSAAAQGECR